MCAYAAALFALAAEREVFCFRDALRIASIYRSQLDLLFIALDHHAAAFQSNSPDALYMCVYPLLKCHACFSSDMIKVAL